jgi:multidrug transporter EmrE-like cation transporter
MWHWGQVKPYMIGRQGLAVAYDVFNGVGTSGLVACSTALGQQHGIVLLRRGAL